MAKTFKLQFEFTSSKAYGDNYTLVATTKATDERAALAVAHLVGFEWFGARFNDNCVDWRLV